MDSIAPKYRPCYKYKLFIQKPVYFTVTMFSESQAKVGNHEIAIKKMFYFFLFWSDKTVNCPKVGGKRDRTQC